ncbi:AraC family transcriptional regulator [Paenibacillus gorillae]|uniref:AraC family transcriptional regulator n=1 Tax=Paenibacillus gorillae TaxID=1243662 RepID=UPI001EE2EC85|nr:AraC family transcriptional regulator [Paenibacillus gorillae]
MTPEPIVESIGVECLMKLEEHMTLWNYAAVKVLDIRHSVMNPGDKLQAYILPASGFIYSVRGSAMLSLDGMDYAANRHFMWHGGKGMRLDIEAKEMFEYFLLFYRAALPGRKDIARLTERSNPFQMQYGFEPLEPLPLHYHLIAMEQVWTQASPLERIQIKGLFYQFIYEMLKQLRVQGVTAREPDLIGQVVHYIEDHYRQNLSLESIAEQFNYSPRHLSMRFKGQTGSSMIEYLIRFRLRHAEELLRGTDASLRDIAVEVGYPDVYYFSRLFRKFTGQSPIRYRKAARQQGRSDDRPFSISGFSIGRSSLQRYNVDDYDNHYQHKTVGGSSHMQRTTKSSLILALMLSITLLLSACGAANSGSNLTGSNPPAASATAAPADTGSAEANVNKEAQTRTITTIVGDVVVPANPKRVVVLYLQGDLVAFGIKPVGTSDVYDGAAFAGDLEGIEALGQWFEPNPEAIMALKPDLILVPSTDTYDKLKDIAPTVVVPFDRMTTDERVAMIGKVFGKEQEAKTLLDNFHSKVEEGKKKLAAAGILDRTVSIIEGGKKDMAVVESKLYGRGSQIVYEYLEMKAPEIVQKKIDVANEGSGGSVSMEVLPKYLGDYVIRSVWDGADDLSDNAIWQSVPAVKQGRVIEIEFGFCYYSDIYSLDKQLDFIVEKLLAADGKN